MDISVLPIVIFVVLESLNILILYFFPGSRKGNGMGVFSAYSRAKGDPQVYALIRYLINWVAGTKVIIIALLLVILFSADKSVRVFVAAALILSISTFFFRLFPAIRKMDADGEITPRGYSRQLAAMIVFFLIILGAGAAVSLIFP